MAEVRTQTVISGALVDYAKYQYYCGHIQGMKDALTYCDEIEGDLDQ